MTRDSRSLDGLPTYSEAMGFSSPQPSRISSSLQPLIHKPPNQRYYSSHPDDFDWHQNRVSTNRNIGASNRMRQHRYLQPSNPIVNRSGKPNFQFG